jgi:hypothetical protein
MASSKIFSLEGKSLKLTTAGTSVLLPTHCMLHCNQLLDLNPTDSDVLAALGLEAARKSGHIEWELEVSCNAILPRSLAKPHPQ